MWHGLSRIWHTPTLHIPNAKWMSLMLDQWEYPRLCEWCLSPTTVPRHFARCYADKGARHPCTQWSGTSFANARSSKKMSLSVQAEGEKLCTCAFLWYTPVTSRAGHACAVDAWFKGFAIQLLQATVCWIEKGLACPVIKPKFEPLVGNDHAHGISCRWQREPPSEKCGSLVWVKSH